MLRKLMAPITSSTASTTPLVACHTPQTQPTNAFGGVSECQASVKQEATVGGQQRLRFIDRGRGPLLLQHTEWELER